MKSTVKHRQSFQLLILLCDIEDAAETTRLHISYLPVALKKEMKHRRRTALLEAGDMMAKERFSFSARDVDPEPSFELKRQRSSLVHLTTTLHSERGGALCKPWNLPLEQNASKLLVDLRSQI
ncbi:hypothetical protein F2Q70_00004684 [Brassica cretica]|uniref:Uncharacterized protein n=1 Tax=Brassica cretica TaxID=69181 RepID=A0A3N6SQ27_BRACR|nr:hypothetical protein F2Q70_00004684 [Brassica cretica]